MDMKRCKEPAGTYTVSLYAMHHSEEFKHQIGMHAPVWIFPDTPQAEVIEEPPAVSNKVGFEGELCVHEVAWLENGIPGTDYPKSYEFTWGKVK